MAEKLTAKQAGSFEEVLMSNVYTQEALINLLEAEGIEHLLLGALNVSSSFRYRKFPP